MKPYSCQFCGQTISFQNRKPYNVDGTPHRCKGANQERASQETRLYAMAAMNAIISGQIQAAGVDHIYHMNFHEVADAAWQAAAAMVSAEKNHGH